MYKWNTTLNEPGRALYNFGDVRMLNGAEVTVVPTDLPWGAEVTVTASAFGGDNTGTLHIDPLCKLVTPATITIVGVRLSLNHDSALSGASEVIIGEANADPSLAKTGSLGLAHANISSIGTVRVMNGKITVLGVASLHVTTFELASAGRVDGTGGSHSSDELGLGHPTSSSYAPSHGGTGYGGMAPYGSVTHPTTTGSGGHKDSRGGGAVHITASTAILNGAIEMEGMKTSSSGGGGSGGSVWIETNVLQGSGASISVQGADGYSTSYSGGAGGRVALTCTSSEYTGGSWAGYTNVPDILLGGGASDHWQYPQYSAGGGTAYVNCGDADRTLISSNRHASWPPPPPLTIVVTEAIPGLVYHNVRLLNRARLTFARPASSPLDATTAAIASLGGDRTGSLIISSGDIVFLGSNDSMATSLEPTSVVRRAISGTVRQIVTTHTIYTSTVDLTGANICVDAGGKLDMSPHVYMCGTEIVNRGLITGMSSFTKCTSPSTGGVYHGGHPTGSTVCGNSAVDGAMGGCLDPTNPKYNPDASVDDGSCTMSGLAGCTYPMASNYNRLATANDGSCILPDGVRFGCTYVGALNYAARADMDDGSCVFPPSVQGQHGGSSLSECPDPVPCYNTPGPSAGMVSTPSGVAVVEVDIGAKMRLKGGGSLYIGGEYPAE